MTAALAFPAVGAYDTCNPDGPLKFVTLQTPLATFYIDDRGFAPVTQAADGATGGIWIYQESNDVPSLQRGGSNLPDALAGRDLTGGTDPCGSPWASHDTLIL